MNVKLSNIRSYAKEIYLLLESYPSTFTKTDPTDGWKWAMIIIFKVILNI